MKCFVKLVCLLLALCVVTSSFTLSVGAVEVTLPPEQGSTTEPLNSEPAETTAPITETTAAANETTVGTDENVAAADDTTEAVTSKTKTIDSVPLYFQTDYPDTPYAHGTVATSGCGVTCLAMVATYLSDHEYLPDNLAERAIGPAESNIHRMELLSNSLKIPAYEKIFDWQDVMDALANDKVVIILLGESSMFTDSQHLVVLTKLTGSGKILVNDPFKPNYERSELKEGFKNGFSPSALSVGFAGGWAYKKDVDPNNTAAAQSSKAESVPDETTAESIAKVTNFDTVPLYFQADYPDTLYGNGTIASNGCSVTSLAMVASYLTKHEYRPDMIADYIADFSGRSHIERLEYASDLLQLPWSRSENFYTSLNALKEGKIVIALMNERSLFTDGQHFIVLTGINEDGKIMVNDSNRANYDVWNLKNAFVSGFKEGDILCGYSGAWIYDVSAMPEEPFIYEKSVVQTDCRYPDIYLSLDDKELLARMVWVEARGESFEGQQAIAEIVLNRLVADNFPNTLKGVIYAANQFKSTQFLEDAEPTRTQYEAVERALSGPYVLPMDVVFFARYAVNDNIWGKIGGHTFCYQW